MTARQGSVAAKGAKRALLAMALAFAAPVGAQTPSGPGWTAQTLAQLRAWARAAPDDALPPPSLDGLDLAVAGGDGAAVEREATGLALRLARLHLLGAVAPAERKDWNLPDPDAAIDLGARLRAAQAAGRVDAFFAGLAPRHGDYALLRGAYLAETDLARRIVLARNMERWRWLPQSLGTDYLLVNAAAFEARLWRGGEPAGSWRVIVGKTRTPTPVFAATITGVTLNPWWDVPPSIVRESVGVLLRRNPALARQRGYVRVGGQVRQRPGDDNALGRMKLVMPNPYSVYLHDTPNRDLFAQDQRALSHGCVRVGDALGLAARLLEDTTPRSAIDALVERGDTVTLPLARPLAVYIVYFTAGTRADASFGFFPDIYQRDGTVPMPAAALRPCVE